MRISYLILAHNTPNHLSRLINALHSTNSEFFIHVDRKSDISPFRDRVSQSNITFVENRVAVHWGDFSAVSATVKLIREALSRSSGASYLVLLSGSDYPLKSTQYIEEFFRRHHGQQFINLVRMPCEAVDKPLTRLQDYWLPMPDGNPLIMRAVARLNRLNMRLSLIRRDYRKVFKRLRPYAGSQWWALTADACRYILSFIDANPSLVKFYENVYVPDESFFQTIIGNSEFATDVTRNLTFTDWSRPNGGPALIDMEHLQGFLDTEHLIADDVYGRGELLFARKFGDDSAQLTSFIDENFIRRSA